MKGMDVVQRMEQVGSADGKPSGPVKILDCGETSANKINNAAEKERGNERVTFGTVGYSGPIVTFIQRANCDAI